MIKTKVSHLTKKDISKKIKSNLGSSFSYANNISEDLISIIKNLVKKKDLNIKNFGLFKTKFKNKRMGRNPKNGKVYVITSRKTLSFLASKKVNDKIN